MLEPNSVSARSLLTGEEKLGVDAWVSLNSNSASRFPAFWKVYSAATVDPGVLTRTLGTELGVRPMIPM